MSWVGFDHRAATHASATCREVARSCDALAARLGGAFARTAWQGAARREADHVLAQLQGDLRWRAARLRDTADAIDAAAVAAHDTERRRREAARTCAPSTPTMSQGGVVASPTPAHTPPSTPSSSATSAGSTSRVPAGVR